MRYQLGLGLGWGWGLDLIAHVKLGDDWANVGGRVLGGGGGGGRVHEKVRVSVWWSEIGKFRKVISPAKKRN